MDNKQLKTVMQEPLPMNLENYEERIRRNLLVCSALGILFGYFNLELDPNSRIFGFKFTNLNEHMIFLSLLIATTYELVNYFWILLNKKLYWNIRLTASKGVFSRNRSFGFDDEFSPFDYNVADEQSNFYVWMIENQHKAADASKSMVDAILDSCDAFNKVQEIELQHSPITMNSNHWHDLSNKLTKIENSYISFKHLIDNPRVELSMRQFDSSFSLMLKAQSFRFFLLDALLPIGMGVMALGFLGYRLY